MGDSALDHLTKKPPTLAVSATRGVNMTRKMTTFALAAVALSAVGLQSAPARADRCETLYGSGWGRTEHAARQNAILNVNGEINRIRGRNPQRNWRLSDMDAGPCQYAGGGYRCKVRRQLCAGGGGDGPRVEPRRRWRRGY
jgi:hypothetical protein